MRLSLDLAPFVLSLGLLACPASSSSAPGPSGDAPSAKAVPEERAETTGPGTTAASTSSKPLSAYLATATAAKVSDGSNKTPQKTLTAAETKAALEKYDLSQIADGPVVRCPPTEVYAFEDAAGQWVGSISLCSGHARFDAPDKTFGGIKARPR